MSSILKALKKLEHDKAPYRPDECNIDMEILRDNDLSRFSAVRVMAAGILLLAAGSGATYMYMRHEKASEPVHLISPVQTGQNRPPVSKGSEIKTEQLPAVIEVVPAERQSRIQRNTPHQNQPVPRVRAADAPAPAKEARTKPAPKAVHPDKQAPLSTPLPSSVSTRTVPVLRVNGIAFLGENSDNVAMINGIPLSRGSLIEGVKIEDIYKNMVRFSFNGEKFEILLGQSNK